MFTVTGTCKTRLSELRKYSINGLLSNKYITSNTINTNGLDITLTTTGITESTYIYYIDGIKYTDNEKNGTIESTKFEFSSLGNGNTINFENSIYIKDESINDDILDEPEFINDVNIERQSLSVFDNIYRLDDVNNLSEMELYGGGNKFKIKKNI